MKTGSMTKKMKQAALLLMLCMVISPLHIAASKWSTVMVSTASKGFSTGGQWRISAAGGYNGTGCLYATEKGAWAKFSPCLGVKATADVAFYHMGGRGPAEVRVDILKNDAVESMSLDLSNREPGWITLGSHSFTGGMEEGVRVIKTDGDATLRVNMVRFDLTEYTPTTEINKETFAPSAGRRIVEISLSDSNCVRSGEWRESNSLKDDNGKPTMFTVQKGASATYKAPLASPSRVKVSIYKAAFASSDPAMEVEIFSNGRKYPGKLSLEGEKGWVTLGEYDFIGGGKDYVKLTRQTDGASLHTRIGGVKFEVLGELFDLEPYEAPEEISAVLKSIVLEVGAAGYESRGRWQQSNSVKGFGGKSSYFTTETGAVSTYRPNITVPSVVEVYLYQLLFPESDPAMQVDVEASGKNHGHKIDLSSGEEGWRLLGAYEFDGSGSEKVTVTRTTQSEGLHTRISAVRFDIISAEGEIEPDYIVLHPREAQQAGDWRLRTAQKDYDGAASFASNVAGSEMTYFLKPEQPGEYVVEYYRVGFKGNGDPQALVSVMASDGETAVADDQRQGESGWISLGTFNFSADGKEYVKIIRKQENEALYTRAASVRLTKAQ